MLIHTSTKVIYKALLVHFIEYKRFYSNFITSLLNRKMRKKIRFFYDSNELMLTDYYYDYRLCLYGGTCMCIHPHSIYLYRFTFLESQAPIPYRITGKQKKTQNDGVYYYRWNFFFFIIIRSRSLNEWVVFRHMTFFLLCTKLHRIL